MIKVNKLLVASTLCGAMLTPGLSSATNGMNMEGYGPIATGMGGASMAYDNGAAATMNNPATIGLMGDGEDRLDIAVGTLSPDITSESQSFSEDSTATMFIMPALGWVTKTGKISYGVGMFSQGGMGTEYDNANFMTGAEPFPGGPRSNSGKEVRSEVGVGRVVFPLSYNVNSDLTLGGSVDFVWGGMDILMDLNGAQFADLVGPGFGGRNQFGRVSGSLLNAFGGFVLPTLDPDLPVNWGRVDFSDGSPFTGSAMGTGAAAKLGLVYAVSKKLRLGGSYHSKTSLSDLSSTDATLTFSVNGDDGGAGTIDPANTMEVPLKGKVKVNDFQWPEIFGIGMAFEATPNLMLVADYKRIFWSKVMDSFNMTFTADAGQAGMAAVFDGTELEMELYQDWEDQNVIMLGGAYQVMEPLVLRFGVNLANNPVPDEYMNPLFPAIIKNHFTLGAGYVITKASALNFSLAYAPAVMQESDYGQVTLDTIMGPFTTGEKVETSHSQTNMQLMYSYMF